MYQAQIVPLENEQVEFDHSLEVQTDMLELRNAILEADTQGTTTFATVQLGTSYPTRILAINPPPVSGSLRTGPPQPVTVVDGTGTAVTGICPTGAPIQTRTLEYTPGYNEYRDHPTLVYENTVLYLNFSGQNIVLTDEQLVRGDTVNINPLNTSFSESGRTSVSVEPTPGLTRTREVQGATVTTPTSLSEETWEQLLEEDVDPENVTVSDGNLTIDGAGDIEVNCAPVGLNDAPPGGARGAGGVEINPIGPNDVAITGFARPSNDVVEVTFNNTASRDTNVTEARISFYNNPSDTGGDIGPLDLIDQNGDTVAQLEILGPNVVLDPEIWFPGNETETTLTIRNTGGEKFSQDDFFVIDLVFANGERGTYFVDIPA
ncbi:hypothetical protein [Halobaculum rarum]|uniref:hypothetical protein n=1 Tax=Halobaculum rarum TaxID=3075122 RepID=UPI0032AF621E